MEPSIRKTIVLHKALTFYKREIEKMLSGIRTADELKASKGLRRILTDEITDIDSLLKNIESSGDKRLPQ